MLGPASARPGEDLVSKIARFAAYAAAFEKAFESDDWSLVEPFFSEDAVYDVDLDPPMGGRFEGRPAILAYFKQVLDRFDRRFESRSSRF
jgi:ketosteroid isomerase-like protein